MSVGEKSARQVAFRVLGSLSQDQEEFVALEAKSTRSWKSDLIAELNRTEVRKRLSVALAGVACINLATFALCQWIYVPDGRADLRHPLFWFLELLAVLGYLRAALGPGWVSSSSAMNLVVKFWTTFLILSFNLVTLNSVTGFGLAWYKPAWATLSTFLFASLAWAFSPWFFVAAVQMWATGLLMVHLPDWCFLIYGVSWWFALVGISIQLRRNRLVTR